MFLVYGGNMERELRVSCYTDAGYLTDADDLKSQQDMYAEYIAAFDASMEAVWIRKFISGLGIVPTIKEPISMYCENTRAIAISKDDRVTKGARHFGVKVHYLRETIKLGDVKIEKVDTNDNLVDPFTKALEFLKHYELTRNIRMLPIIVCGSLEDLEIIQEEDTHPSIDTSLNHKEDDLEIDEPQSYIVPIRRSTRTCPRSIPMQEKLKLSKSQGASTPAELKRMQNVPYALSVGSIIYASAKQSIFTTSSVEVEYIVAFDASKEAVWVSKFISGLGVVPTIEEPISMYCHNTGAIAIANESGITKADPFTKALAFSKHSEHTRTIEMLPASSLICFGMKDLGEAAYILRIKIYRDISRRLIGLCQSAYIEKILKRYCMENSKCGSIPMQEKLKLSKSQGASTPAELKRIQNVPYASANPGDIHWTTVKNILKYLRNTKDMFLVYEGHFPAQLLP
nr:hypothetical protein [Tanacetum cinerariifolium]